MLLALLTLSGCQQLSKTFKPTESPYQRRDWPHWIDADKNCRNTRQCTVKTGLWTGPYTGKTFTTASDVDIDHLVPLVHEHRHCPPDWTRAQRRAFAMI